MKVTNKMIVAVHDIMLKRGDFVLSARLIEEIYLAMDALANHAETSGSPEIEGRPCTCHPDDKPPVPCQKKFAYGDCAASAEVERDAWIDPKDKTQSRYLPNIGQPVLFCHNGKTYIGKHTGGCFKAMTPPFRIFTTWECHWMPLPAAMKKG